MMTHEKKKLLMTYMFRVRAVRGCFFRGCMAGHEAANGSPGAGP